MKKKKEQIGTNEHRQGCKQMQRGLQQIRLGNKNTNTKKVKNTPTGLNEFNAWRVDLSRKERFLADILVKEHVVVPCKLFTEIRNNEGKCMNLR